ncbi:MAG: hypothetical protein P4N59_28840 [Negativicutes bacterium]|nr:hypothetical protein [Negativicutes bacterium]
MKQNPVAFGSQTVNIQTTQNGQSTLNWILSDNLNSTTVAANSDGSWSGQILYSAFGEFKARPGGTPANSQHSGQIEFIAVVLG